MRTIKFRVTKKALRNGKIFHKYYTLTEISPSAFWEGDTYNIIAISEYTGLKSKSGVEIYEGDICNMHIFTQELGENLGVVEGERELIVKISMSPMGVLVNNEPLFAYFDDSFDDMSEPFEVIGNIHENPELIL